MQKSYKVAEHLFIIEAPEDFPFWPMMEDNYGPFEVKDSDMKPLFTIIAGEIGDDGEKGLIYTNRDDVKDGFITFSVYKRHDGSHYFEISQPGSQGVNGCMSFNSELSYARIELSGRKFEQWLTFNTAVNLCFHISSSCHNTLLMHSSAVEYKGRAYLFLGKSGTGKSTHSMMWLNAIDGVTLMNDDHPVVRVFGNEVMAYGSPWSGKTRCYKNLQAPLGGIIRIVRSPHNRLVRLPIIHSYASVMTSCGGMIWEKRLADCRDSAIQSLISRIPCWNMECLPNEDAARICSKGVSELWESVQ